MSRSCCLDLSRDMIQDCFQEVSLNGNYTNNEIMFEWDENAVNTSGTVIIQIETVSNGSVRLEINGATVTTPDLTDGDTFAFTANPLNSVIVRKISAGDVTGHISLIINYEG